MKCYDYLHQGLTNGNDAVPGRFYEVLRTKQKLKGETMQWRATKSVMKTEAGKFRLFVRDNGSTAYFGDDDMLR